MAINYDILCVNNNTAANNGDALIVNGDFATGVADMQAVKDTINGAPGWFKQYPGDGVNIRYYLNSSGLEQQLIRACAQQLDSDGYDADEAIVSYAQSLLTLNPNIPSQ